MIPDKYFAVNGIVLKYSDFSESSRILTLFTDKYGLLKVSAKGARRKDSKLIPLTQPFAFCRYQLCRGKNDLHTLTDGELIENFYALAEDIDRFTAAGELTAELLKNVVPDEPEPEVLRLYLNSLFALCYSNKSPALVKPVFTLRLKFELGFLSDADTVKQRFIPDSDPLMLNALDHIFGCELKNLYGFEISADLQEELRKLAGKIRSEDL